MARKTGMRTHYGRSLTLVLMVALAGCAPTPGTTDTAPSPTPGAIPAGTAAIEPGTYRISRSEWSVVDFTVTIPEGWTVQYGSVYLKHSDAPFESSAGLPTTNSLVRGVNAAAVIGSTSGRGSALFG